MAEMPEGASSLAAGSRTTVVSKRQAAPAHGDIFVSDTRMLMEQMVGHDNLLSALKRVEQNGGAAGVDGMSTTDLRCYLGLHWKRIRSELLTGRYRPFPVRRVEIPKPGGGTRSLGIPTALDRFVQQCLAQVLSDIFDPSFSDSSYGFRPGKSAHQAVTAAKAHVRSGLRWVVDIDLEKFFDRVNHDVLMGRLAKRIEDKRVLKLVRSFLESGVMLNGVVQVTSEGTPQGGPLSPLLSNVLLDELDKELESRGHRFCRYADDCNVYVRSKAAGERVMESLRRFLEKELKLRVNLAKSAVDRPWNRKFLGYSMSWFAGQVKLKVAPQSVKRAREKLKEIFRRGRGQTLKRVIAAVNKATTGWVRYFRLSEVKQAFEHLDIWIRRRLRCILWRQWKRTPARHRRLIRFGLCKELAQLSAGNGRGPWWNSDAPHMREAVNNSFLAEQGLVSLLKTYQACRP